MTELFKEGAVINTSDAVNGSSRMRPENRSLDLVGWRSLMTFKSSFAVVGRDKGLIEDIQEKM